MRTHRITNKQIKFADEYIKTRNAYKSAITAGYSEAYSAKSVGELLKKEQVALYIDRRLAKMDQNKIATQEEILAGLTRVFRREETEDVVTSSKDGDVTVTKVRNSVSDSNKAANDLLKIVGKTTSSRIEMQKLRKAIADAKIAERQAESDSDTNVTIKIEPWEDN